MTYPEKVSYAGKTQTLGGRVGASRNTDAVINVH
jgi:hypothetical protein